MSESASKDLGWGVEMTALNQALADGRTLQARQLMAQGHRPELSTLELIRKQDRAASHGIVRQAGHATDLLPGSRLANTLAWLETTELADKMARGALDEPLPPKRERGRL